MTSDPACCLPSDSVSTAAQLMKSKDVGPIPVISDKSNERVVGIITDRDLAVKVLAEGLDPQSTHIEDVMTRNPVCCRENESLDSALRAMSMHQIRRIPVVDSSNRLTGIIAQADIARKLEDAKTGAVVEDISADGVSTGGWLGTHSESGGGGTWTAAVIGAGLGLGLMYLLDPVQGQSRRSGLKERATKMLESVQAQRPGGGAQA